MLNLRPQKLPHVVSAENIKKLHAFAARKNDKLSSELDRLRAANAEEVRKVADDLRKLGVKPEEGVLLIDDVCDDDSVSCDVIQVFVD